MKKLKWAKQKFKEVNFDYNQMKKFGFKPIKIGGYDHMIIHQKKRIIIKSAMFCSMLAPPKKYRVQTVIVQDQDFGAQYQIQPFCHINKRKINNDLDAFKEKVDPGFEKGYDIHGGNLGYYRNKLVMFDW